MKQINMTDEQYEVFKKLVEGTELSFLADKDKAKKSEKFKIPKKIDIEVDTDGIKSSIDDDLKYKHEMMSKRMKLLIKYAKVYHPFVWNFIKKVNGVFESKRAENGSDSTLNWYIPHPIQIESLIFSKEREINCLKSPMYPIYLCSDVYRAFRGDRTEHVTITLDARYDQNWKLGHPYMRLKLGGWDCNKTIELDNDEAPNKLKDEFDKFAKELFNRYLR